MPGVTHIRYGGTWRCINFDLTTYTVHARDAGTWKEVPNFTTSKGIYVRDGGSWIQVYASPTNAWTTAEYGPTVAVGPSTTIDILKAGNIGKAPTSGALDAHWSGQGVSVGEQMIGTKGHAWSPTTTDFAEYGYARRIKIEAYADTSDKYAGSVTLYLGITGDVTTDANMEFEQSMGNLSSYTSLGTIGVHPHTLYEADYDTRDGWGMTEDEIYDFTSGTSYAAADTNYSVDGANGDQDAYIAYFKASYKYYTN